MILDPDNIALAGDISARFALEMTLPHQTLPSSSSVRANVTPIEPVLLLSCDRQPDRRIDFLLH